MIRSARISWRWHAESSITKSVEGRNTRADIARRIRGKQQILCLPPDGELYILRVRDRYYDVFHVACFFGGDTLLFMGVFGPAQGNGGYQKQFIVYDSAFFDYGSGQYPVYP